VEAGIGVLAEADGTKINVLHAEAAPEPALEHDPGAESSG
jgi:hypothetical protein